MSASQPALFNLQEFTDGGITLVGGRLYTYFSGVTTFRPAFTDPAGLVPHTYTLDGVGGQYIALDARGELPAPLYLGTGSYDIALKRADGSTVWTRKADGVDNAVNAQVTALAASTGSMLVGFIQSGSGTASRASLEKMRERVSIDDFFLAGEVGNNAMAQRALSSGAKRIVGNGKSYDVFNLKVPAGVIFDGEGGQLLTSGSNVQDVVVTDGEGSTISNWSIKSNTPGTRKGRYGVLVAHNNTKLINLAFWDITYTALFNDADNTNANGIFAQNCGWDAISNYQHARNSTFRNVKGIGNGRSLFSTDAGARSCVMDGFESIDNGLDEIASEHKDVLHFEYATDCTCKNGVVRYTAQYTGGTIAQTWAMMRWNASTNCHIENVEFKIESTVNGRLILGLIDRTGADGNTGCSAKNISVNSEAISAHKLVILSYDGNARFRLLGALWRGYVGVESRTAGVNAFENISDIDAAGPGSTSTLIFSEFNTHGWTIAKVKCRGYTTPYNLNGFQDSSIRDGEIEGATGVAFLLDSQSGYVPNGGIISNMTLRGATGTVLITHDQTTRSLMLKGNAIDGSAAMGLDTQGSNAFVKGFGNLVGGSLTAIQSGPNTAGAFNANMNNVAA